ncbi:F-box/kelch-repeat protein At3g23880-like [Bidens hawaiensis]|uniref:F-box/kelch-repeat protein At3g23880-like n=1 Tax=Bidens hawaiensis TaxID=980011 RepID=UPI004049A1B3
MSYDDHMCEELVVEILSRLPTKSLLRFRSVSKSLYAVIGSPEFILLHTLRSPKKVMISHRCHKTAPAKYIYTLHSEAQMSSNNPYTGIPPAVRFPFTDYKIFGSCNGILCIHEYPKGDIHLWNPSIRRKVIIVHDHPLKLTFFYVARPVMLGFCFDPTIDDYKILMMHKPHAFVYTMKTHTWQAIASPPYYWFVSDSQCLLHGALHWLTKTDHYYNILTFHLSSEVFSTIELPEPSSITFQVTTIKGSLAAISSDPHAHSWIWVRNTAAASWSAAYKFDTNPFKETRMVLQIAPSEEFLCCRYFDEILVYKSETQSRVAELSDCSKMFDMNMCVESLGLLDMGTSWDQGSKENK